MNAVSRRDFLGAGGAIALVPATSTAATPATATPTAGSARAAGAESPGTYLFFNAAEAAFIEAAVDRLIPPDAVGPSATQADVHRYLDLQLHGAWGAGERLYRSGPWHAGTPSQGYQLPYTPAELFRTALRGIRDDLAKNGGTPFERLDGDAQDRYLTQLQAAPRDLAGVPSNVFFESLLSMTIEGYFSDPAYGGNKDMAAWIMIGFPGAYANYYELVDRPDVHFTAAPRSLAEDAAGHVHAMPNLPAGLRPVQPPAKRAPAGNGGPRKS